MYFAGFLLVLGPLVTVHELGHYLVGRWLGVKADAFSVGFGKELIGRTDRHGTRWKLSMLPLGGYVQFRGDMNPASTPNPKAAIEEGSFQSASLWRRSLIVAAGPVTNLLVAIGILAALFAVYGQRVTVNPEASVTIGAFGEQSVARNAGMQIGDRITAVDGVEVDTFEEIARQVALHPGKDITVSAIRGGEEQTFSMTTARVVEEDGFGNKGTIGKIGVGAQGWEFAYKPVPALKLVPLAIWTCWDMLDIMVTGLKQIIFGDRSIKDLGGPIKIAKYSGERLSLGPTEFIYFAALISLNLAFINFLPIPALDGGHLAFYAAEAIRRKPAGPQTTEWAYRVGIAIVLIFMVVVTVNDVGSLSVFGG